MLPMIIQLLSIMSNRGSPTPSIPVKEAKETLLPSLSYLQIPLTDLTNQTEPPSQYHDPQGYQYLTRYD